MEEEIGCDKSSSKSNEGKWDTLKDVEYNKDNDSVKKIKGEYYRSEYVLEEGNGWQAESSEWVKMTPAEVEAYKARKAAEKEQRISEIRGKLKDIFKKK